MVLAGTLLPRLLLSNAMIHLGVGYLFGPGGVGVIEPELAQQLVTLTLVTVAVSVGGHGVSVKPLMNWYVRDKPPPG